MHESLNRQLLIQHLQHHDENMSKVFFDELRIPRPAMNLRVGSGPHGAQAVGSHEAWDAYDPRVLIVEPL